MESYIVRIYRRDKEDSEKVTGMLESVEQQTRRPFLSLDALRSMLHTHATANSQYESTTATAHELYGTLMMSSKSGRRTNH